LRMAQSADVTMEAARRSGGKRWGALHFFEDGPGGCDGIGCLGDGAADDEIAGSCGEGSGGSCDAFLVGDRCSRGADAGDDEGRGRITLAEGGEFFCAGHEAGDARLGGGFCEAEDLVFGRVVDANGGELELIHAGEDGDGEQLGRVGAGGSGFGGGFEHGGSTGGVDGEELRAEGGDGANGSRDGVGDVVELEVEEDGEVAAAELADDGGAFGDEELESDFEAAAEALELAGEGEGRGGAGVVEGDDEAGIHRLQVTGCRVRSGHWVPGSGDRVRTERIADRKPGSRTENEGQRIAGC
jgi:hypothetical protein